MSEIVENLEFVRERMRAALARSGCDGDACELIAVSKTFPVKSISEAMDGGQFVFGESRFQEAEPKISTLPSRISWHFIGRLQRNKLRKILPLFDVIHAFDSLRLAEYANGLAKELGVFPKIFLQVNVANESSKGGFKVDVLKREMENLLALDRLDVLGLMTIPPAGPDAESARPWFVKLRELRDQLEKEFEVKLPGLSMGMSQDYETAIEEGATHVRVGSLIFGKRNYRVEGELG